MFNFLRNSGGVIKYYHLEDFWKTCTQREKALLERYNNKGLISRPVTGLTDGKPDNGIYKSKIAFFTIMLGYAKNEKEYKLCDKLIEFGDMTLNASDIIDQHFYLQLIAEIYYIQRESRVIAKQLCEKYCLNDIDHFPQYRTQLEKEFHTLPHIKTFQRLVIMYEKDHNYEAAKNICLLAIKYGLRDSTTGGFEARLQKIEKKLIT